MIIYCPEFLTIETRRRTEGEREGEGEGGTKREGEWGRDEGHEKKKKKNSVSERNKGSDLTSPP